MFSTPLIKNLNLNIIIILHLIECLNRIQKVFCTAACMNQYCFLGSLLRKCTCFKFSWFSYKKISKEHLIYIKPWAHEVPFWLFVFSTICTTYHPRINISQINRKFDYYLHKVINIFKWFRLEYLILGGFKKTCNQVFFLGLIIFASI